MMDDRYRLQLDIILEGLDEHGNASSYNGQLRLSERHDFDLASFLEVAAVLGQFHELAKQLKAKS